MLRKRGFPNWGRLAGGQFGQNGPPPPLGETLLKATSSKNEISLADLFRILLLYVKAYFKNVHICNLEQKLVDKLTKLSKTGFTMECFTADFYDFLQKNVKIWFLGDRLGTCHQIQAFKCFS